MGVHGALVAFFHRPSSTMLLAGAAVLLVGWLLHVWAEWSTRAPSAEPGPTRRPPPIDDDRLEPPAVIALTR